MGTVFKAIDPGSRPEGRHQDRDRHRAAVRQGSRPDDPRGAITRAARPSQRRGRARGGDGRPWGLPRDGAGRTGVTSPPGRARIPRARVSDSSGPSTCSCRPGPASPPPTRPGWCTAISNRATFSWVRTGGLGSRTSVSRRIGPPPRRGATVVVQPPDWWAPRCTCPPSSSKAERWGPPPTNTPFGAAAIEVLYGRPPFEANSLAELVEGKESGRLDELPDAGVPGWVRPILRPWLDGRPVGSIREHGRAARGAAPREATTSPMVEPGRYRPGGGRVGRVVDLRLPHPEPRLRGHAVRAVRDATEAVVGNARASAGRADGGGGGRGPVSRVSRT